MTFSSLIPVIQSAVTVPEAASGGVKGQSPKSASHLPFLLLTFPLEQVEKDKATTFTYAEYLAQTAFQYFRHISGLFAVPSAEGIFKQPVLLCVALSRGTWPKAMMCYSKVEEKRCRITDLCWKAGMQLIFHGAKSIVPCIWKAEIKSISNAFYTTTLKDSDNLPLPPSSTAKGSVYTTEQLCS